MNTKASLSAIIASTAISAMVVLLASEPLLANNAFAYPHRGHIHGGHLRYVPGHYVHYGDFIHGGHLRYVPGHYVR